MKCRIDLLKHSYRPHKIVPVDPVIRDIPATERFDEMGN